MKDGAVDNFHILIDCGSKGRAALLKRAVANLKEILPDAGGGRVRLDLLVATHEHADHIKGFDPEDFDGIQIENIWMSAAMNAQHPQAEHAFALNRLATRAMRNLAARDLSLSPELQGLVALYELGNDGAMEALRTTLPTRNAIEPKYVHADMTEDELAIETLQGATLKVLGPEENIDLYYLGDEGAEIVHAFNETTGALRTLRDEPQVRPESISGSDFRRLRSRMMSGLFAFTQENDKVINNTSVVLLIEWKGRRLLFVGDAEWTNTFRLGQGNGSWNTMWNTRPELLGEPIDFLKIGHHGSENATPWSSGGNGESEPARILNAILPLPADGEQPAAKALVSTARGNTYPSIPRSELLVELGKRVGNARKYLDSFGAAGAANLPHYADREEQWLMEAQPPRTDLECILSGKTYVDIEIEAE
ncbi:MBL fold metallo-hydrolase [Mesorhizobium sp. M1006]|uniref:MBL fold metallo-hydrolase n=3 Tax=unclassified Mesorhizobium TaxID=325217 RepID=UPI003339877D